MNLRIGERAGMHPPQSPIAGAHGGSGVRGERALGWLQRRLAWLLRLAHALIPAHLNPFAHTGAIATVAFIVAAVTGIAELIWYSSSVHNAYLSVEAMTAARWTGGIVRSLHRYSSDVCMAFALLHGLLLLSGRRLTGPRWLPFVTGVLLIGVLWFIGWTGYWLVWDERAQLVALGSARALDLLPIFAEPLTRSFLTDGSINSLLFFMVFFLHMLVPLLLAVLLWIHIMRLSRARYLPPRTLIGWVVGSMVAMSIVWPATSAGPARMGSQPEAFTADWWYLLPLGLTERMSGGALWAMLLVGGIALLSLPWVLRRGPVRVAEVVQDRCNACKTCVQDCPYDAIAMVPRPLGSKNAEPLMALVDPDRCVGCGVCTGSCNGVAIGLDWLPSADQRRKQDGWLKGEHKPHLAFVCAEGAGGHFSVDVATGDCAELPGYKVEALPCAGWLHAGTVERALRHGAAGVLVVGCHEGTCAWREGFRWTRERLGGSRKPALRPSDVEAGRVRLASFEPGQDAALRREAEAFRRGQPAAAPRHVPWLIGAGLLAATVGAVVVGVSDLGFATPAREPALVVSFNHPGERGEHCRDLSPEELAERPPHMRQPRVCERGRAAVRLRVTVDGTPRIDEAIPPGGLSGDGNSVAVEQIPLAAGEHRVRVEIGDSLDPERWDHVDERTVTVGRRQRRVVLFDKRDGFRWE